MYRTVYCEFWTDPKVRSLSPHGKLVFLYLITNPHSHLSGIYYLPMTMMQVEIGIGRGIDGALQELSTAELIYRQSSHHQIWVVNMFRHQGKGQKTDSGVARHLNTLHASPLITRFLEYYPRITPYLPKDFYRYPIDAPSIPHADFASPVTVSDSDSSLLTKTNSDPDLMSKNLAQEDFEQFWQQYPRKIGKKAAHLAWRKAHDKPPLQDVLLAVDRAKRSEQWTKEHGQYIPHPATWLNQGRWSDTPEIASPKGGQRPPPPPPKNDPIGRGLWSRTYGNPKEHGYE